jgi:hypothetical protein
MQNLLARHATSQMHVKPRRVFSCSPETERHWSHVMSDFDRLDTRGPHIDTDSGCPGQSNAAIVERNAAARFIVPILQWLAGLVDGDDRRHDHRRPIRFWGDE